MNKKRLSVVMAGAMLASSVAPIMAEEVQNNVETSAAQKGALANELAEKLWNAERFSEDAKRVESGLERKSVYAVVREGKTTATDKEAAVIAATDSKTGSFTMLQNALKDLLDTVAVGEKVKLVNLGSEKVTEKNDAGEEVELIVSKKALSSKYTETELKYEVEKELAKLEAYMTTDNYKLLIDVDNTKYDNGKYTIAFQSAVDLDGKGKKTIELTTNSDKLNFMQYISKNGTDAAEIKNMPKSVTLAEFKGFATAATAYGDIEDTDDTIYTITPGGDTFAIGDLYDAPFLTSEGQNLLDAAKEAALISTTTPGHATKLAVRFVDLVANPAGTLKANELKDLDNMRDSKGTYKVAVYVANAERVKERIGVGTWDNSTTADYDVYTVTGTSKAEMLTVLGWLDAVSAKVDVLSGEDRYATAVKIAKEAELTTLNESKDAKNNIVLVNGNSLVDGLAAAPLAGYLSKDNGNANTPILLTEAGKLPNATKRYLRELIDKTVNKDVTVHIVGGTGVVSKSIERELKDLGLKVERYAGEDRHETSMAVAEKIGTANGAFVVGAEGEADAMSISGKAAELVAPVIVSGFDGLSEEALDEIDGANVTVIGGDSKVSKVDYEKIEAVAEKTSRIFGSDRKATNAAVINRFYKNTFATAKSVLVAKDDVLVDALTAANLSSKQHAPIVLATSELSKDQINAVVTNADEANKVYQIGGGVAPSVVKTIAEALNIIK